MEWTSDWVKTWFFRRDAIPSDITAGNPIPSNWPLPYGNFAGDCDFDANFQNQRIILDNSFCGSWAKVDFENTCAATTGASSCAAYVGNNPQAFTDMYV